MRSDPRSRFSDGVTDDRRLHVAVRGESEAFRSDPASLRGNRAVIQAHLVPI